MWPTQKDIYMATWGKTLLCMGAVKKLMQDAQEIKVLKNNTQRFSFPPTPLF